VPGTTPRANRTIWLSHSTEKGGEEEKRKGKGKKKKAGVSFYRVDDQKVGKRRKKSFLPTGSEITNKGGLQSGARSARLDRFLPRFPEIAACCRLSPGREEREKRKKKKKEAMAKSGGDGPAGSLKKSTLPPSSLISDPSAKSCCYSRGRKGEKEKEKKKKHLTLPARASWQDRCLPLVFSPPAAAHRERGRGEKKGRRGKGPV